MKFYRFLYFFKGFGKYAKNSGLYSSDISDIQVVVGLDFGITCSGFSYCHVAEKQYIHSNFQWPGEIGLKTNTVLQYDDEYKNVEQWGHPALVNKKNKPVELFKVYLLNNLQPQLPIEFKKVITDYLRENWKGMIQNH